MMTAGGMDAIQLLRYGVTALVMVLCALLVARALWAPVELRRTPACGACGHGASDLVPGRCPECGADYLRAGVCTPALAVRLRGALWPALLAWTVLMGVAAFEASLWVQRSARAVAVAAPRFSKRSIAYDAELRPRQPRSRIPGSGDAPRPGPAPDPTALNFRIGLSLQAVTATPTGVESGTITLKLRSTPDEKPAVLEVDVPTGACVLTDPAGKELSRGQTFDRPVVKSLFQAAGVDPETVPTRRSVDDVERVVTELRQTPERAVMVVSRLHAGVGEDGGLNATNTSSRTTPLPPPALAPAPSGLQWPSVEALGVTIVVSAIYLTGCGLIAWRYRRLVSPGRAA